MLHLEQLLPFHSGAIAAWEEQSVVANGLACKMNTMLIKRSLMIKPTLLRSELSN